MLRNTLYQGRCYCVGKEVAFSIRARKSRVQGSRPVSPSGVTCHLCSKGSGGMFYWPCLCPLHSLPPGLWHALALLSPWESVCVHTCAFVNACVCEACVSTCIHHRDTGKAHQCTQCSEHLTETQWCEPDSGDCSGRVSHSQGLHTP